MSVIAVLNTNKSSVSSGKVSAGGGEIIDRIRHLESKLELVPGVAGTVTTALKIIIHRDASQGTVADSVGPKFQFGEGGRAEQNVFPMDILMIDDTVAGTASLLGKIECKDAFVESCFADPSDETQQTIEFRANRFSLFNAITAKPTPPTPVVVPGFKDEDQDS